MPPASLLRRIVYVSAAVRKLSGEELDHLLVSSRAHNAVDDITGALLYADGDFMQLIEGPAAAVAATFQRIQASSMHHNVIALVDADVSARLFANWSMAYSQATWKELQQLQAAWRESSDAGVAVLQHFARGRSRFG